ncbi:Arm DNA-binding domain-containing protein [Psychrobacter sanguinis]|uniref:Arm DNA-binding domain-containing protein n=1 Tax=Psychrobacter sanguinis TaxID=861445 RepID=UPI00187794D3|nr:Arm DNA-binding domain-containing protein [Psychrobacter sanguinis]
MSLTNTQVKNLKPSEKSKDSKQADKYSDGEGLQLWVRFTGVKSWISAYRWQGKQQTLTDLMWFLKSAFKLSVISINNPKLMCQCLHKTLLF